MEVASSSGRRYAGRASSSRPRRRNSSLPGRVQLEVAVQVETVDGLVDSTTGELDQPPLQVGDLRPVDPLAWQWRRWRVFAVLES
jgi:hypothetical protein